MLIYEYEPSKTGHQAQPVSRGRVSVDGLQSRRERELVAAQPSTGRWALSAELPQTRGLGPLPFLARLERPMRVRSRPWRWVGWGWTGLEGLEGLEGFVHICLRWASLVEGRCDITIGCQPVGGSHKSHPSLKAGHPTGQLPQLGSCSLCVSVTAT